MKWNEWGNWEERNRMYSLVNVLGPTAVSKLQGEGSNIAKSFKKNIKSLRLKFKKNKEKDKECGQIQFSILRQMKYFKC